MNLEQQDSEINHEVQAELYSISPKEEPKVKRSSL